MNSVVTILILAGVPLFLYFLIGALTMRGKFGGTPRYRPGQKWEYPAMWWSGNPEGAGTGRRTPVDGTPNAVGGASGNW